MTYSKIFIAAAVVFNIQYPLSKKLSEQQICCRNFPLMLLVIAIMLWFCFTKLLWWCTYSQAWNAQCEQIPILVPWHWIPVVIYYAQYILLYRDLFLNSTHFTSKMIFWALRLQYSSFFPSCSAQYGASTVCAEPETYGCDVTTFLSHYHSQSHRKIHITARLVFS